MVPNYETKVCLYRICSIFYKHTMKFSTLLFSEKSFIICKCVHWAEQCAPWMQVSLKSQNVALFEDTVFIDAISWDHTRLGWDLEPEWCSYKKENTQRDTEKVVMWPETETGVMPTTNQGMPRLPAATGSEERNMGQILPQCIQKEPTLPTPPFWNSGLLNCWGINFCGLQPPSLWNFVTAVIEN